MCASTRELGITQLCGVLWLSTESAPHYSSLGIAKDRRTTHAPWHSHHRPCCTNSWVSETLGVSDSHMLCAEGVLNYRHIVADFAEPQLAWVHRFMQEPIVNLQIPESILQSKRQRFKWRNQRRVKSSACLLFAAITDSRWLTALDH